MTSPRFLPCPSHRDDLMGWRFLVLDVATGETVRDGLTETAARAICSRRNGVDTAPRPYGCVNLYDALHEADADIDRQPIRSP